MLVYVISFSIITFCGVSFFRSRRSKNTFVESLSDSNVEASETVESLSETRRQQMEARRQQLPRISQTSILRCLIKDYFETKRYRTNLDIFHDEHPSISLDNKKMTTLIFARFSEHYPVRGINALIS